MNYFSGSEQQAEIDAAVRGLRMIGFAMASALIVIGSFFALQIETMSGRSPSQVLFLAALAVSAVTLALSFSLPKLLSTKINANSDLTAVIKTYRSTSVISLALCEAAAILMLVCGFINGRLIPEYIIAALPVSLLINRVPNTEKFQQFYREIVAKRS
jgi:F0F1-type ATP synthase membrane subunit c/vacuolar-type H+-ATPase subunit K